MTRNVPREAATPRLLRRLNAGLVLDALRDGGPRRVAELAARTGLSRPTVAAVAEDLVRLGWVVETAAPVSGAADGSEAAPRRGRPARALAFRADAGHVAGVDIGEYTVRAVVADLQGEVVAEAERHPAPGDDGAARLRLVRSTAAEALQAAGLARGAVLAAGVSCTGAMDTAAGQVLFSSAFPGLPAPNLRRALRGTLGPEVLVDNDCNLAVVGERWRGVAAGVDDVICVMASERLGAGIVVEGRLVRGHAGAAGEMAFLGAYEAEHGAEGIAELARTLGAAAAREHPESALAAATSLDAVAVFDAARAGDAAALGVVEDALRYAGRAIVTMALVLNPELVVIGAGSPGPATSCWIRCAAGWRPWCGCRRASRSPRSPSAAPSWAPSGSRSTTSRRGCWTGCRTRPEARPARTPAKRSRARHARATTTRLRPPK
jgi:predicted NBD/HSP70 family sugar kinase